MDKLKLSEYFSEIYDDGTVPSFKVLIDGRWVKTKQKMDLISPVDGSKIAEIGSVDEELINKAVSSADSNKSKIRGMAAIDRIELMNTARVELEKHKDEIVNVLVRESGKSFRSASGEFNAMIERLLLSLSPVQLLLFHFLAGFRNCNRPCAPLVYRQNCCIFSRRL